MKNKLFFAFAALFLVSQAAQAEECPEMSMDQLWGLVGIAGKKGFRDPTGRQWIYSSQGEKWKDLEQGEGEVVSKGHGRTASPSLVCDYDVVERKTKSAFGGFRLIQERGKAPERAPRGE